MDFYGSSYLFIFFFFEIFLLFTAFFKIINFKTKLRYELYFKKINTGLIAQFIL